MSLILKDQSQAKIKEISDELFPKPELKPEEIKPITSHIPIKPEIGAQLKDRIETESKKKLFINEEDCRKVGHVWSYEEIDQEGYIHCKRPNCEASQFISKPTEITV